MKTPSRLLAVVVLLALAVSSAWYLQRPAAAQEKKDNAPPAVTKWEYSIVVLSGRTVGFGGKGKGGGTVTRAEEELNKLGEEGFEIAFVTAASESPPGGFGAKGGGGESIPVVYYTLKRAKK
jgi:hypothetical protein